MSKPRVLIARRVPEAVAERARREFDAVLAEQDLDAEAAVRAAAEHRAEALVIGPKIRLDAAAIARLPDRLRIVANTSVGFDHVDTAAARNRSLAVTNTPDVLTDCTADLAFMLILCTCRRASEYERIMREGWRRGFGLPDMLGLRPSGRTLGIVGMGRIGRAVAERARGFGMRVLYSNRSRLAPELEAGAEYFADWRAMLPRCQILSLHLPGGPGSDGMMDGAAFALLPRGAVFVNAARGSLVDEDALIEALRSGQLFAAGLDVYRREPDFDTRLAELPNVFLTPHVASATVETRNAMGFRALDNVSAVLAGRPPIDPV
jgi:lactate dehydrogenase-like 2-hydroxyacid dehydrogenase